MMRRRQRTRGFTLLESLVALAIAAIVLNGFYGALSTGTLLQTRADTQADRMLVAATVMDRVGVDLPLRAGVTLNEDDWTLAISDVPPPDLSGLRVAPGALLYVSVSVQAPSPDQPPVVLRAIRYAETPL